MEQEVIQKAKIKSERIVEILEEVNGLLTVKNKKTENFLTLIMYIGVTNNDIQLLHKNLLISKIPYEKNMYSRFIAMKIKEFFDDYGKFLSRSFLEAKRNKEKLNTELIFKDIRTELKNLKAKYYKDLYQIRHFSSAHTNEDPRIMADYFLKDQKIDIESISNNVMLVFEAIIWKLINYMEESLNS